MIKVFIADDHKLFRSGLIRMLNETDDIVVAEEAADGKEVLEKINNNKWDILLLDINMPDLSGLDVLRQIENKNINRRILIISMYPEDEYAIRAIRSGASGYLTKDCSPDILINVIRRIANGGRYIDPVLAEKLLFNPPPDPVVLVHTKFSVRELQVFKLIAIGKPLTEIAENLSLSVKTVSTYRARILDKMNMKSNAQLIRYAVQHNLV